MDSVLASLLALGGEDEGDEAINDITVIQL